MELNKLGNYRVKIDSFVTSITIELGYNVYHPNFNLQNNRTNITNQYPFYTWTISYLRQIIS